MTHSAATSVCRKSSHRRLKKVDADTAGGTADTLQKVTKSDRTTVQPSSTAQKSAESADLIAGRLTVRRAPRVDVMALMMEGVKEMDVIWYSAADAAQAMLLRQPTFGLTAAAAAKQATKKLMAKKAARQQRKMLQQLAADVTADDVVDVDEQRPSVTELPIDEAATSEPCRRDILKHLLASAPPPGVNITTYECYRHVLLRWPRLAESVM